MVGYSCSEILVGVIRSAFEHARGVIGYFPEGQFGKRILIEYYGDVTMEANLLGNMDLDRRCWEGLTFVSGETSKTYTVHISNEVKKNEGRIHLPWTALPWSNPLCVLNEPQSSVSNRSFQAVLVSTET